MYKYDSQVPVPRVGNMEGKNRKVGRCCCSGQPGGSASIEEQQESVAKERSFKRLLMCHTFD